MRPHKGQCGDSYRDAKIREHMRADAAAGLTIMSLPKGRHLVALALTHAQAHVPILRYARVYAMDMYDACARCAMRLVNGGGVWPVVPLILTLILTCK